MLNWIKKSKQAINSLQTLYIVENLAFHERIRNGFPPLRPTFGPTHFLELTKRDAIDKKQWSTSTFKRLIASNNGILSFTISTYRIKIDINNKAGR